MTTITSANRPDICYFSKEKAEQFTDDQMKFPVPDWVVEVLSDSTKTNDRRLPLRGIRFKDYEAHGVQEYWIVDPKKEVVEQYVLQGESYELLLKTGQGTITSHILTNFEIPVQAIFDRAINLDALRQIATT